MSIADPVAISLERQIRRDPGMIYRETAQALQVYSDYLTDQDDPEGRAIALRLQIAKLQLQAQNPDEARQLTRAYDDELRAYTGDARPKWEKLTETKKYPKAIHLGWGSSSCLVYRVALTRPGVRAPGSLTRNWVSCLNNLVRLPIGRLTYHLSLAGSDVHLGETDMLRYLNQGRDLSAQITTLQLPYHAGPFMKVVSELAREDNTVFPEVQEVRIEDSHSIDLISSLPIFWAALPRARFLRLHNKTRLEDRHVGYIAGVDFPGLRSIDLSFNHLTDRSVEILHQAPWAHRLEYLRIGGNNLSAEGIRNLHLQFLNCEIDWRYNRGHGARGPKDEDKITAQIRGIIGKIADRRLNGYTHSVPMDSDINSVRAAKHLLESS